MADSQLYEDTFSITDMNPGRYDRVGRAAGTSQDSNTIMTLDINTDLYPLAIGDHVQLLIASTLNIDGTKDDEERGWREKKGPSLADMWDYVCYGKVYKFEDGDDGEVIKVYVSFGGLLLYIEGPYKKLTPLRVEHVYLLLKK